MKIDRNTTIYSVVIGSALWGLLAGPVSGQMGNGGAQSEGPRFPFYALDETIIRHWDWPAETIDSETPALEEAFGLAQQNSKLVGEIFWRCRQFVRGWLVHVDEETGLIPSNLTNGIDVWEPHNAAADNYPFMVLTCVLTDRAALNGVMLGILETEKRLTSRVGTIPDTWSFSKNRFASEPLNIDRVIFAGSEYAKDGLMPLTEWQGPSAWSQRMLEIIGDIWENAPFASEFGSLPSDNPEVNGEMMQVTSRIYWMTGEEAWLDRACRVADWYLLGNHHPTEQKSLRLRDHGCELISGLTEVYFACRQRRMGKADQYREPIYRMLDRILEVGINEQGLMVDEIDPGAGRQLTGRLSDNWGYNYNGYYTVWLTDGVERYRQAVIRVLSNLEGNYHNHPWEGTSHDGYADTLECAINLYNREPVESAARWIDTEIRVMLDMQRPDGIIGGWHGDGNYARTALMVALWKSQGLTVRHWREDVRVGAVRQDNQLLVTVSAKMEWTGRLIFDRPRHRDYLHLPLDYPRINQFPEWFTVASGQRYKIKNLANGQEAFFTGEELIAGYPLTLLAGRETRLIVTPQP